MTLPKFNELFLDPGLFKTRIYFQGKYKLNMLQTNLMQRYNKLVAGLFCTEQYVLAQKPPNPIFLPRQHARGKHYMLSLLRASAMP